VDAPDIYRIYFHGPAYQVLDRVWRTETGAAGAYRTPLPPDHEPSGRPLATRPRLLELCFQTAGIWEIGMTSTMALPTHIDRVSFAPGSDDGAARCTVRSADGAFDATVTTESGDVLVQLNGYRTVQLPGALRPEEIEPLRDVMLGGG
jgi:hypothetical protein